MFEFRVQRRLERSGKGRWMRLSSDVMSTLTALDRIRLDVPFHLDDRADVRRARLSSSVLENTTVK